MNPGLERKGIRLLLLASLLLIYASWAEAAQLRLRVRLRELGGSKPIDAKVTIEAGGDFREFTWKGPGECEFNGGMGSEGADHYQLSLSPPSPYVARTIRIRGNRSGEEIMKTLSCSLGREREDFTYRYLDEGVKYFSRQFDNALAHYEIAYDRMKGDEAKEYQIKLKYYYAKALHNTCTSLDYATCSEGIRILGELMECYEAERRTFRKLGLSKGLLIKDQDDMEDKERIHRYRAIPVLFQAMKYIEAAALAEEALEASKQDPQGFARIGLPGDRLLTDAGVSYLKAAEEAERRGAPPQEIKTLLENSREHLEKVKRLNPAVTRENLEIIEEKLRRF